MDWKQEMFKRLDILGEKLGVTANHLWAVLVRQAYAEALGNLVIVAGLLVGIVIAVRYVKWFSKQPFEQDQEYKCIRARSDKQTAQLIAAIFAGIGAVVAAVAVVSLLYYAVLALYNPEYFALQKLLEALKP